MTSDHPMTARAGDPARFTNLVDLLLERASVQANDLAYLFQRHGALAEAKPPVERLTYGELVSQACSLAAELQALQLQGHPVLLLFGSGLDFIRAYCACLLSGAIATPLRPPLSALEQRQANAIGSNSQARAILTTSELVPVVKDLFAPTPAVAELPIILADRFDAGAAKRWAKPAVDASSLALIQYTSGSTGMPKGVRVSHANVLANEAVICEAFGHDASTIVVGWLPMFHDMGLIGNVLQPLYLGVPSVLMDPLAFVQSPVRWLQLISEHHATTSGGPNFAYELCVRRVTEDEKQNLDLSSWQLAFSGAEPVRMETMRRFSAAFASARFSNRAFYPCYGLAESTLFVTGIDKAREPSCLVVDRAAVGKNRVVEIDSARVGKLELACCGFTRGDQTVRIVDPHTRAVLADDAIGEIWLAGSSTAGGYLHEHELTEHLFRARLADDDGRSYLRTGDLGFLRAGQLYVSGRLKDLIIVRGRNHYPDDIEATAARVHAALRPGSAAAFTVELDGAESVVLVQEVKADAGAAALLREANISELLADIRAAVLREHGLKLHDVALVAPRTVPKTSSGKLQRQLCKALYESESLQRLAAANLAIGL